MGVWPSGVICINLYTIWTFEVTFLTLPRQVDRIYVYFLFTSNKKNIENQQRNAMNQDVICMECSYVISYKVTNNTPATDL